MAERGGPGERQSRERAALWAVSLGIAVLGGPGLACNALLGIEDGTTTDDAGGAEASGEAGLDALADGTTVDVAPGGPFCASQPTYQFCEDFDEDAGLTHWGMLQTVSSLGGSAAVSTHEFLSPPNSFLGIASQHPQGGTSGAFIERTVNNPEPDHMTCDFDVRIDVAGQDAAQLFNFFFYDASFNPEVGVAFNLSNYTTQGEMIATIVESDLTSTAFSPSAGEVVDFTSWQHVSLSYATTPMPRYTLLVTGQPLLALPSIFTANFTKATVVNIAIGPLCYDHSVASSGWQIYIDNIVCR